MAKIRETAATYNMSRAKAILEEEKENLKLAQESLKDVQVESEKKIDKFIAESTEENCVLTRITKMRAMVAAARFDQQQLQDYIEQKNGDIKVAERNLEIAIEQYRIVHKRLQKLSPIADDIKLELIKDKEICLDGEQSQ